MVQEIHMAERKYEISMGSDAPSVSLTTKDEGPTLHAREGKRDTGLDRKVYQALSGLANLSPYGVRPARPSQTWARIVPVLRPEQMLSSLIIPDSTKPMFRHRAVTLNGTTLIFRQGAGDIIRIGDFGDEQEWVMLDLKDVILRIPRGTADAEPPEVQTGWIITLPLDAPQESSSLIEVVDRSHIFNREWTVGRVAHGIEEKWDSLNIQEGDEIIYPARTVTEISMNDMVYHAVRIHDVYGVKL